MNQLVHIDEFKDILKDYRPSDLAKKTLEEVKLVLLVGPSASGRNTIINELVKTGRYYHIVSDTTREKRLKGGQPIEQDGREYWFHSEEEFLTGLRRGEYIEAAIVHNQQASGCNFRELIAAHEAGQIAIKDIDPVGADTYHHLKPDALIIFSVVPSFDIWMERLHARGQMAPDELIRRMESAEDELSTALKDDYYRFIINDTVEGTTAELDRLATTGYYDPFKERLARETTERLHKEVRKFLVDIKHRPQK
jgi:guanylate kinase